MAEIIEPQSIDISNETCHLTVKSEAGERRVFGEDLTNRNINHRKNKRPISSIQNDEEEDCSKPAKRRRMEPEIVHDTPCIPQDTSSNHDQDEDIIKETCPLKYLAPCDQDDEGNCNACVEYIEDIFRTLRERETAIATYMDKQTDINGKMRTILLDWLTEVHCKFKLSVPTFHLMVQLLDRFLSVRDVKRTDLQLLGSTCLWVSAKYHEIYAPEITDFTYVADQAFTEAQMLKMEVQLLSTLKFDVTRICPVIFLQRFIKIFTSSMKQRHKHVTMCLAMLFLEEALLNYETALTKPSLLAAAVVAISFYSTVEGFHWNEHFVEYTGYQLDELMVVIGKLNAVHTKMCQKGSKFMRGLKRKFSGRKYERVASLNLKNVPVVGSV